jgi:hypothetical protein
MKNLPRCQGNHSCDLSGAQQAQERDGWPSGGLLWKVHAVHVKCSCEPAWASFSVVGTCLTAERAEPQLQNHTWDAMSPQLVHGSSRTPMSDSRRTSRSNPPGLLGCLPLISNAEKNQQTRDRQATGTSGISKSVHVQGEACPAWGSH